MKGCIAQREALITTKEKKPAKAGKTKKSPHALYDFIMDALNQDKGENIVSIDLAGKSPIADYMIIVTGSSSRQVTAMANKLRDKLSTKGIKPKLEGMGNGDWVIVDAGDVIVHIFRAEVRAFYNLEKLWSADFATTDYTLYKSV